MREDAGIGLAALWVWLWLAPAVRMYSTKTAGPGTKIESTRARD